MKFKLYEEFDHSENAIANDVLHKVEKFVESIGYEVHDVNEIKKVVLFEGDYAKWTFKYDFTVRNNVRLEDMDGKEKKSWYLWSSSSSAGGSGGSSKKMSFNSLKKLLPIVREQTRTLNIVNEFVQTMGFPSFSSLERSIEKVTGEDFKGEEYFSIDTDIYYRDVPRLTGCQFCSIPKDMIMLRYDLPKEEWFDHVSHRGREQPWAGYAQPFTDNILRDFAEKAKFGNDTTMEILEKNREKPLGTSIPELARVLRGSNNTRRFGL